MACKRCGQRSRSAQPKERFELTLANVACLAYNGDGDGPAGKPRLEFGEFSSVVQNLEQRQPPDATTTFAFLAIGLTTRVREFVSIGAKPFYAFTIGVAVNVTLGFVLSTRVFSGFWNRLGQ